MKRFIVACLLMVSSVGFADESHKDYYVDVTAMSYHFCKHTTCTTVNNERNWGIGTTIDFKNNWEAKIGGYKNSYSKSSYYALANYYHEWSLNKDWMLRAGLAGGVVSGYYGTEGYMEQLSFAEHKVQLGVLPNFTIGYKRARAVIGYLPGVATLQFQYLLKQE